MTQPKTEKTFLKDYQPPAYWVDELYLEFRLDLQTTTVYCRQKLHKNRQNIEKNLKLDGENLTLKEVKINGKIATKQDYQLTTHSLLLETIDDELILEITTEIHPAENKSLEGLYQSGDILCTQNEAQGFRRITYYQDRPDVMTIFTTKIIAEKEDFPILLANGNLIESGELSGSKHYAIWQDPFAKPCYLFALVAGQLDVLTDHFITMSGRKIELQIYCDPGSQDKCHFAMKSLQKAMAWDEKKYGREYDLDLYMIVAVASFNMGAMENKGLNIFNSALVLADEKTATDNDFMSIESVIAHEYFHNWTGNRITCRDWFQLTLKEGLTVFRDQQFSADMNSEVVKRIEDVAALRNFQFPEDSGPMSHPIKPDSYIAIDNFYSVTVYEKGAEVIRMIHTFLGEDGFRRGMDEYFKLYDGQAVTTEDFLHAMSVGNDQFDFRIFQNWYEQAGTPHVTIIGEQNEQEKTYRLKVKQYYAEGEKKPLHFPLKIGLVSETGQDLPLQSCSGEQNFLARNILEIKEPEQEFLFTNIDCKLVPSLNRDFSVPAIIEYDYSKEELAFLMQKDSNVFCRYEAGQSLAKQVFMELLQDWQNGKELKLDQSFVQAMRTIVVDSAMDLAAKANCMSLPGVAELVALQEVIDYAATIAVKDFILETLARELKNELKLLYDTLNQQNFSQLTNEAMANRALKAIVITYLSFGNDEQLLSRLKSLYEQAGTMTDRMTAISLWADRETELRQKYLEDFYTKYQDDDLVLQKWFAIQALSRHPDTFAIVRRLEHHPKYDKTVPNFFRSLIFRFAGNKRFFHSQQGYQYIADKIQEMDTINPQMASSLAKVYKEYKKLTPELKSSMEESLQEILATENLSKNTYEVVTRTLQ